MSDFFIDSVFFGAALTLAAYELGALLRKKTGLAIFSPIIVAAACIIPLLLVLDIDYDTYNMGAQYISYLLTPATVALAIPLYRRIALLKKHLGAILCGLGSGILAGGLGTLGLCLLFDLEHSQYVTLLPKSVTTAIGMGLSEELGGVVAITAVAIMIAGNLGPVFAELIFRIFRIRHPIARGLALGNASHAVGTSKAMELGEIEGAMSSLAIAVAGLLTVVLAPIFATFL